tara:strand:+ start:4805 stop:5125 length:321 start_codon:yes stop_codon:yes gene_type:complete
MDVNILQKLKNEISKLDKIHHLKILKILKDNNIKYSENRNGIFINMATIDEKTINIIQNTLLYVKEQEKQLKDIESMKAEMEKDYFKNDKPVKDNTINSVNANEFS